MLSFCICFHISLLHQEENELEEKKPHKTLLLLERRIHILTRSNTFSSNWSYKVRDTLVTEVSSDVDVPY